MKKLQSLVCFLLLSMTIYAADQVIQLPKPNINRSGQLMKALSDAILSVNMLPKL